MAGQIDPQSLTQRIKAALMEQPELQSRTAATIVAELYGITSSHAQYHKYMPACSRALQQLRKENLPKPSKAAPKPSTVERVGDEIRTFLGTDYGTHVLSSADFSLLLKDYSREWEGKALNQDQLAVKYGFANAHAVARFVKIHGIRQTSAPFTTAEMESLTPEEAAELAGNTWKQRYFRLAQKKKFDAVAADAAKWNNFDEHTLQPLIEAVQRSLPRFYIPKLNLVPKVEPYALVTGPADLHFMKQAFGADGQPTYNKRIAVDRMGKATEDVLTQSLLHGTPEVIYYLSGNDGLHVDGKSQKTTAGTEQAGQTEGHYSIDFDTYIDLRIANITRHAQVGKVKVWVIPDNHAEQSTLAERRVLEEVFRHHPHVDVVRCYHPRQYVQYGQTGMLLAHGHGMKNLKGGLHKLILVEAREQGVNIAQVLHWLAFTGHLHFDEYSDLGGVKHFGMPSLCAPDDWHRLMAFVGSTQEMAAYRVSPTRGRLGNLYSDGL